MSDLDHILAGEVAKWKTRFEQEKEAFAAEHAEVERLRAERTKDFRNNGPSRWRQEAEMYMRLYGEQRNEVERLRAEPPSLAWTRSIRGYLDRIAELEKDQQELLDGSSDDQARIAELEEGLRRVAFRPALLADDARDMRDIAQTLLWERRG